MTIPKPVAVVISLAFAALFTYLLINVCKACLNQASDATGYISFAAIIIATVAMLPVVNSFHKARP